MILFNKIQLTLPLRLKKDILNIKQTPGNYLKFNRHTQLGYHFALQKFFVNSFSIVRYIITGYFTISKDDLEN